MKRQLSFDLENGQYVLKENNEIIFSIDGKALKFVSLDFYNGVYKDKVATIEVINQISEDEFKKGRYIFEWLTEIITSIQLELNESEISNDIEDSSSDQRFKLVPLYELSACAGSGFYSDGPSTVGKEVESTYLDADYAVKISGKSMEPTILDQSIVFVKADVELQDGDVGIFVVDGSVMCKRFREEQDKRWLQPDNDAKEYKPVTLQEGTECTIQGKVLFS